MLFFAMIARNCNWHDSPINVPILLFLTGAIGRSKLGAFAARE